MARGGRPATGSLKEDQPQLARAGQLVALPLEIHSVRLNLTVPGIEPRVIVTDKLASYVPAIKRVLTQTEHRRHKRLNNRAENSHRPVRKRERAMQRFKSPEQAQRFLETFSAICNHFRPRRHRLSAGRYRQIMSERFQQWRDAVCLESAA